MSPTLIQPLFIDRISQTRVEDSLKSCDCARMAILKLNDFPDSLVMQPRSLEHCTVKALCILKPGNYNGCNLWACRGLVNKIGATMQHLFHNVIAAAFHLSVQWPLSGYWIIMK